MTVQSTIDKLRELRLSAMAGAFEDQCRTGGLQGLSFEDRFGILVDREWESRRNNRLARLIRSAGFRYPGACMEDIEYHADRKLDRGKLLRLSGCGYIRDSLIITAQWSRQSGKVRAIVPMAQSHFDFACLFWTCWSTACQGRSRYSGALAAFTSSAPASNLAITKS